MVELAFILVTGLLVGSALGLTGSGGSLFAIPSLLYVVDLNMEEAVPVSLLVIGATALLGAIHAFRNGLLLSKPTLIFGLAGIIFTPVGFKLGSVTPESLRILGFSLLAIILSVRMGWQSLGQTYAVVRAAPDFDGKSGVCRFSSNGKMKLSLPCAMALTLAGASVGILSGLFGVGGGFLIVPALMFVIRMDMRYAVASSLAIIAMISLSGGAFGGIRILLDQTSTLLFGVGSLLGMVVGRLVSSKIAGPMLQRVFASALFLTGVFMTTQHIT